VVYGRRGPCLLWPNGWVDHDATSYGGWPRLRRHSVRRGPNSSTPAPKKGTAHNFRPMSIVETGHIVLDGAQPPQFSAHVCCGQMAGWIKMPLGTEVDLGPGPIVLDGDPAPPFPQKRRDTAPNFRPMSLVAKWLDGSRCHLVWR